MGEVTLTRLQIEAWRKITLNNFHPFNHKTINTLCTLALERLDMEPRPIADNDPFEGPCLLYCGEATHDTWPGINRVLRRITKDGIVCFHFDKVPMPKLAIEVGAKGYVPLSSLPKPKGPLK